MKLTRRKALAGIGIGAVGAAGVFGSGAFTSVDADRDVNIEIVDDSDGALALIPFEFDEDDDPPGIEPSFVTEDGTISFDFDDVNANAEFGFTDFYVKNNGNQTVRFWIDWEEAGDTDPIDSFNFFAAVDALEPSIEVDGELQGSAGASLGATGGSPGSNSGAALAPGAEVPVAGILTTGEEGTANTSVTLRAVGDGDERYPDLGPSDSFGPLYGDPEEDEVGDVITLPTGQVEEITALYTGGSQPEVNSP